MSAWVQLLVDSIGFSVKGVRLRLAGARVYMRVWRGPNKHPDPYIVNTNGVKGVNLVDIVQTLDWIKVEGVPKLNIDGGMDNWRIRLIVKDIVLGTETSEVRLQFMEGSTFLPETKVDCKCTGFNSGTLEVDGTLKHVSKMDQARARDDRYNPFYLFQ